MGGPGSGNWHPRKTKKATTDGALPLSISAFGTRFQVGATGSITWAFLSGHTSNLDYTIRGVGATRTVVLKYHRPGEGDINLPVVLQITWPKFGGQRWWFTCPIVTNGVACGRRVGTLFLPRDALHFGCRHCHQLT
jgi:hypothetical protein